MSTTIYDIAKATSVSPATVSRVINGRPGVSTKTVAKVKETMERLNFQPRWKAFDRKRLLLLVPDHEQALRGTYLSEIVAGVVDASFKARHTVVMRPFLSNVRSGREIRQLVMQEGAFGCLMVSLKQGYYLADRIGMEKVPHVIIGYKEHDDDMNQVLLNDYQAGKEATEYLLSLNHQKIAIVSFSHEDHGHAQRVNGYIQALKEANPKQLPVSLEYEHATRSSGAQAARELLSSADRPTAVIVTNELMALGFQREAKQMGFSIPQDFSLIGFEDGNAVFENLDTPLTAMRIPAHEMGVAAVELLIKETSQEKDQSTNGSTPRIPLTLIARRSTLALKS